MDATRAASNAGSKEATLYQRAVCVFADQAADGADMLPSTTQAVLPLIAGFGWLVKRSPGVLEPYQSVGRLIRESRPMMESPVSARVRSQPSSSSRETQPTCRL